MFHSAALRATRSVYPRTNGLWKMSTPLTAVRYNSGGTTPTPNTTQVQSEIQTSLPSFESESVQNVAEVVAGASDHIGYLSSIGMANSWVWPVDLVQNILEHIHVYSGLPWWGTICTATVLARVLMFPLYVKYSDMFGRTSKVKPELDELNGKLMNCANVMEAQTLALQRKRLLFDNGIKNRYLAVPMLQIPIAISFFTGIRQMANYPVEGFSTQGLLWFQDLTLAEPYLGLQTLTALLFMSLARSGGESGAQQFSPQMKKLFTYLPLLTIPATMNLSSGVVLYLAVNGVCSVTQTLLLRNIWVRRKLKITEVTHHPHVSQGSNMGIIESFKENIRKAKEQAERRAEMKQQQIKMEETSKEEKSNSRIKIVRRTNLKK